MAQNFNELHKSEYNQFSLYLFITSDEILLPSPTEFAIVCHTWNKMIKNSLNKIWNMF